jgi:hypothetical protein
LVARLCLRQLVCPEPLLLPLSAIAETESTSAALACDCLAHRFGNAADTPMRERSCPTDMTDEEWVVVRPLSPTPGWMRGRGSRPEVYCHRAMLDAIRYLVDNGLKWRAMPGDFPPWDRVCAFAAGATTP